MQPEAAFIPSYETDTVTGYLGASTADMIRHDSMAPSLEQPLILNEE